MLFHYRLINILLISTFLKSIYVVVLYEIDNNWVVDSGLNSDTF